MLSSCLIVVLLNWWKSAWTYSRSCLFLKQLIHHLLELWKADLAVSIQVHLSDHVFEHFIVLALASTSKDVTHFLKRYRAIPVLIKHIEGCPHPVLIQHLLLIHGSRTPFRKLNRAIGINIGNFEYALGLLLSVGHAHLDKPLHKLLSIENTIEVLVNRLEDLAHLLLLLVADQMHRDERQRCLLHLQLAREAFHIVQYIHVHLVAFC